MRVRDYICRAIPCMYSILNPYYHWMSWIVQSCGEIQRVKRNYKKVLHRLRTQVRDKKIKVLFLLNENSKWKCQRVYDLMEESSIFEPVIALTKADIDWSLANSEFKAKYLENIRFCDRRRLRYVEAYLIEHDRAVDLSIFSPDIVFYPHPWLLPPIQQPQVVSRFALTCYVPYYVICFGDPMSDSQQFLHRFVYRYFLLNKEWVDYFSEKRHKFPVAGEWVGAGHPILDLYQDHHGEIGELVIYAPHWSIPIKGMKCELHSTFLDTGEYMLEYAKKHPEIKWCFKPHPTLKNRLSLHPEWTEDRISAYYAAWEKIGMACYTGEYPDLFAKSRVMITDCCSFLMEYSALNKPLIYLVPRDGRIKFGKPTIPLSQTFYHAKTIPQLEAALDCIVLKNLDPNASRRNGVIRELSISNSRASEAIVQHIVDLITEE